MPSGTVDVLLVGSVPFDTVEGVLETCAGSLGMRAFALPDGEIGPRKNWIQALLELTYSKNPDLDPIRVVAPEDVKSPPSHDPELMKATRGTYTLKPGVTETTLDPPTPRRRSTPMRSSSDRATKERSIQHV